MVPEIRPGTHTPSVGVFFLEKWTKMIIFRGNAHNLSIITGPDARISVHRMNNQPTRADMRQGLEKKVLTYFLADAYEKFPTKLALERGLVFTPLPSQNVDRINPASNSCCLLVDHDVKDPLPEKGNFFIPDSENG